jgi:hypothetical protein
LVVELLALFGHRLISIFVVAYLDSLVNLCSAPRTPCAKESTFSCDYIVIPFLVTRLKEQEKNIKKIVNFVLSKNKIV